MIDEMLSDGFQLQFWLKFHRVRIMSVTFMYGLDVEMAFLRHYYQNKSTSEDLCDEVLFGGHHFSV